MVSTGGISGKRHEGKHIRREAGELPTPSDGSKGVFIDLMDQNRIAYKIRGFRGNDHPPAPSVFPHQNCM